MSDINLGGLAGALAKAQAAFPAIPRDKEVKVTMKSGGSYTFKYAPLDTILAATRKPLSDNGLALVQLLDEGDLVTMLLHSDGGVLSGHLTIPMPENGTVQELGSAITYLRRYSIQAILGIAAEEDDDGNRASGNTAAATPLKVETETLIGETTRTGKIAKGDGQHNDLQYHMTPDGHTFMFRLEIPGKDDEGHPKAIPQVWAEGELGETMFAAGIDPDKLVGEKAVCTGRVYAVSFPGRKTYHRMKLTKLEVADVIIPPTVLALVPPVEPVEAESELLELDFPDKLEPVP
jgi:hypothetical protein